MAARLPTVAVAAFSTRRVALAALSNAVELLLTAASKEASQLSRRRAASMPTRPALWFPAVAAVAAEAQWPSACCKRPPADARPLASPAPRPWNSPLRRTSTPWSTSFIAASLLAACSCSTSTRPARAACSFDAVSASNACCSSRSARSASCCCPSKSTACCSSRRTWRNASTSRAMVFRALSRAATDARRTSGSANCCSDPAVTAVLPPVQAPRAHPSSLNLELSSSQAALSAVCMASTEERMAASPA
mmetsp:Transcript_54186/g.117065  ORF Transcript_54186/g.117065 Transcript_54186/m.117065 type:complete len:249 (+) Transcript_54186:1260-2006(+)